MKDEILAHLHDIARAARSVKTFVGDRTFYHYVKDEQLRSAVERKFEVMGEALNRVRRDFPDILLLSCPRNTFNMTQQIFLLRKALAKGNAWKAFPLAGNAAEEEKMLRPRGLRLFLRWAALAAEAQTFQVCTFCRRLAQHMNSRNHIERISGTRH